MGYTHYFSTYRDFTDDEWNNITTDVRYLLDRLPERVDFGQPGPLKLALEMNKPDQPPEISDEMIRFNGIGELGHDTFLLEKEQDRNDEFQLQMNEQGGDPPERVFNFCKTGEKPYNLAVCVTLLVCDRHAHDALKLATDGDFNSGDWVMARDLIDANLAEREMLKEQPEIFVKKDSASGLSPG